MVCTVNPDGSPATSLVYKTNTLVSKIYPSTGTDAMNVGSQRDTASEQKKVWPNLAAPTGVTATEITSTQVRITWTNNALDQTDFIIARRLESEGTYTEIDGVTGTARSYDDTGSHGFGAVVAGNGYYYCVLAVNGDGVGTIPNLDWTRGPCSAETFVFVQ